MKKERPILFSTPMVEAILAGRKTMTRRQIKYKHGFFITDEGTKNAWPIDEATDNWGVCPYGKVGDILWVRETWGFYNGSGIFGGNHTAPSKKAGHIGWPESIVHKAGTEGYAWGMYGEPKWKPSIHMPKSACRLYLEITSIRIERLKSISEKDAKQEGIEWQKRPGVFPPYGWRNYQAKEESDKFICLFPSTSFETLWNSINGNKSFNKNPWVWVVSFKVIKK